MGHTSLWYFPPNLGRWRLGCAAPFHRYGPFLKALLRLLRSLPNPQFRQSPDCTATSRPVEVDHAGAGHFCACRKKPAHTSDKKLEVLCRSLSAFSRRLHATRSFPDLRFRRFSTPCIRNFIPVPQRADRLRADDYTSFSHHHQHHGSTPLGLCSVGRRP